ncbi:MAG: basic amino acid ABC transporter substrate-binding protein [Anaerolineaceae bacterium]|nr:MAG: basic amino acid ABC transporter substrate-binding protein [Chloroflexi bacterium HGW-Chloroflexi-8]
MRNRILFILSIILTIVMLISACTPKTTPEATEATGYPSAMEQPVVNSETGYPAGTIIRIATDATFPPFEMVDEASKELTGFDVDLMKAIAENAGFQYEFVNLPFDPMLAGVAECQYDMAIAAITITDERKAQFLFSDPYIDAGQIIIVKGDDNSITSKSDLSGKTIGAQLGTTGEIEAQAIEGITYKPYDTYDLAFLDLANGQIDAVIADYPTALGFIAQNPEKLKTVGEKFTNESYGIAICKDRSDLLEKINPALQAVKNAGVIEDLAAKYLAGQ